ncbi:MAG: class I SAM-dependent methyltransferase [Acidimicrobiia bacterium]
MKAWRRRSSREGASEGATAPTRPDRPIDELARRGFAAAADAYEAARPGYPDRAVARISDELGLHRGRTVLDLGAGTGKLTRQLLGRGASVMACEPVAAMRARLLEAVPDVSLVEGTAESLALPGASVDVVTVGQAFHWFDADAALLEIARVLRPGGGLALLWNERDETTPWVAEMSRLIGWHERTVSRYQHVDWASVVAASACFAPLHEEVVHFEHPTTHELLAERVRSISYVAAMPPAQRERLVHEVGQLAARLPEPFPFPYRCRVLWTTALRR